jgi:simple sugar transport system substrate-binding protein
VLLAGLVTAVAMTAGGASGTRSTAAGKVTKVAIATPAKATDYGWNQQGLNGAAAAAKANGATLKSVTNIGYDNTQNVLRQLATGGAQFIIAHASGTTRPRRGSPSNTTCRRSPTTSRRT